MVAEVFIGIDVARDSLEVAVRPTGERWSVGNHTVGIAELLVRVRALRPTLIVLEATGGLELPVLGVLGSAGWALAVDPCSQVDCVSPALYRDVVVGHAPEDGKEGWNRPSPPWSK